MQTAALIVAAGMSSRMGDFKPMLNIGSISIAKRIVASFHQAGIFKIVVITGYKAETLEHHLSNEGLIFLRNENYAETDMVDSARIGLAYLQDKCDRILFTPVDIPLFTSDTVSKLMDSDSDLAVPVCDGVKGHPILISSKLIPTILADSGEGGLRGALERCPVPLKTVPVEDRGILHDADTPDDYRALLEYHNSRLVRPEISVSLLKEKQFMDAKIAMMLTLVDETRSVRTACQRMQISYSTGWNILRALETQLQCCIVERTQGGSGGGRSRLSEKGKALLAAYNSYDARLKQEAVKLFDEYFKDIFNA